MAGEGLGLGSLGLQRLLLFKSGDDDVALFIGALILPESLRSAAFCLVIVNGVERGEMWKLVEQLPQHHCRWVFSLRFLLFGAALVAAEAAWIGVAFGPSDRSGGAG